MPNESVLIVLDHVLHPALAHQDFFIKGLESRFADVVALSIEILRAFDFFRVYFAYVSQNVCAGIEGIIAQRPFDQIEAREFPSILLESRLQFFGQQSAKDRRTDRRVLHDRINHSLPEFGSVHVEQSAEFECINAAYLSRCYHQIVNDGVVQDGLPVAIVNDAALGIDDLGINGIVHGELSISTVDHLQIEQAEQNDHDNGEDQELNAAASSLVINGHG